MSNAVPFTVDALQITSLNPASGAPGTAVIISGSGFGSSQGSGLVMIGGAAAQVTSWSDTQVVVTIPSTSLTGVVRIQQNGNCSNPLTFTLPPSGGGGAVTLSPNFITMLVGGMATIQALNSSGQPVTGLIWASSDPTVASLSTSDPPLLTALVVGHVTITAGTASADITVSAGDPNFPGTLPLGTVLWSVPGNVSQIVPAVPSPSGVADVFAIQCENFDPSQSPSCWGDVSVQAITSDGTVAWTADLGNAYPVLPDFLGGLVYVVWDDSGNTSSIMRVDGTTGQGYTLYTLPNQTWAENIAVHPDGTIFAVIYDFDSYEDGNSLYSVIGIDPTAGTQKFSVPVPASGDENYSQDLIIAGDGYAYLPYSYPSYCNTSTYLALLRVDSSGASESIAIGQFSSGTEQDCFDMPPWVGVSMITNADQGVLLTMHAEVVPYDMIAITTGTSVSLIAAPGAFEGGPIAPVLQAQDGSFVGTASDFWTGDQYMVAFDQTGAVRWMASGNYQPQIATADGGLIATDPSGAAITFDQNGNATGVLPGSPTYSWTGYQYQVGSIDQVVAALLGFGVTWAPFLNAVHFPIDWRTNDRVAEILTPTMWQKFGESNCATVFKNAVASTWSMLDYSLYRAQQKGRITNFYDISHADIGDLQLRTVTGGTYGSNVTLTDFLAKHWAATVNFGYKSQTAVVLSPKVWSQLRQEFTFVHEILLHAYIGWSDDAAFQNPTFQQNGLWRPSGNKATYYISTWMSTDCTCTPEQSPTTCQANTAKW